MEYTIKFKFFLIFFFFINPLLAYEYDVKIIISTEEEIYELYEKGEIDEEERDRLLTLFQNPIDINTATRDELYDLPEITYEIADKIIKKREKKRGFKNIDELLFVEGITNEIFEQIMPFIIAIYVEKEKVPAIKGRTKYRGIENLKDKKNFESFLDMKVHLYKTAKIGFVTLLNEELKDISKPQGKNYLITSGSSLNVNFPRVFASIEKKKWKFIAGHFVTGFGQRVVFDNTSRLFPHGFYEDMSIYENYENAYYLPKKSLFGGAFHLNEIEVGKYSFSTTIFTSYNKYDLYYTYFKPREIYDSLNKKILYETVPDTYSETLGGGNLSLFFDEKNHIGFSGYAATIDWLIGDGFSFANHYKFPNANYFGAIGGDFKTSYKMFTLFGEYARSFAEGAKDENGLKKDFSGNATFAKLLFETKHFDSEIQGRYYSTDFKNPYCGAKASLDQFEGNLNRDEVGVKIVANIKPMRKLKIRGYFDEWLHPSNDVVDREIFFGIDSSNIRELNLGGWIKWRDNNIHKGGRDEDYDNAGEKIQLAFFLKTDIIPKSIFSFFYKRSFEDVARYKDRFEKTHYFYFKLRSKPLRKTLIIARLKFMDVDYEYITIGEKYWEGYFQIQQTLFANLLLNFRYRFLKWVDERESTLEGRFLNPEHQIKWIVEYKF